MDDFERGVRAGLEMAAICLDRSIAKKKREQDRYPHHTTYRRNEIQWCLSYAMRFRHLIQQSEKRPEIKP